MNKARAELLFFLIMALAFVVYAIPSSLTAIEIQQYKCCEGNPFMNFIFSNYGVFAGISIGFVFMLMFFSYIYRKYVKANKASTAIAIALVLLVLILPDTLNDISIVSGGHGVAFMQSFEQNETSSFPGGQARFTAEENAYLNATNNQSNAGTPILASEVRIGNSTYLLDFERLPNNTCVSWLEKVNGTGLNTSVGSVESASFTGVNCTAFGEGNG